jgi:uncharacterized protein (TIGR02147 family)
MKPGQMIKDLFEYDDYRKYIEDFLSNLPNQGHGRPAKIARAISLNPSTFTLVLQGQKDFTLEQANDLCEHLQMTEFETEYFLNLVILSRAGKTNLRNRVNKQLLSLRKRSKELKNRIPPQAELSEEAKAVFYSQWYYTGIWVLTSVDGFNTAEKISERLGIARATVKRVLDFLLSTGLCINEDGNYRMGPQSTHLGSESPLVGRHHQNWRLKAIEKADQLNPEEFLFTSPVSISKAAIPEVKKILIQAVESCFKIIDPAACEELACLNIDWFKL